MSKKIVKCGTCNFFELFDEGEGFCRRYAPKTFLVNDGTSHVKRSKGEIEENVAWPVVHDLDWCGEWEEDSGTQKGAMDEEEREDQTDKTHNKEDDDSDGVDIDKGL